MTVPTDTFDETLLTAYLDNELTSSQREAVERQLHSSESTRKLVSELRSIREMITQVHLSPQSRSFTNGPWNETEVALPNRDSRWKQNWQRLASLAAVLAIVLSCGVLLLRPIVPSLKKSNLSMQSSPKAENPEAKNATENAFENDARLGRARAAQDVLDAPRESGASQNREPIAPKTNGGTIRSAELVRSESLSPLSAPNPVASPAVASRVQNVPSEPRVDPALERLSAFLSASPIEGLSISQVPGLPNSPASSLYLKFSQWDDANVVDTSNPVQAEGSQQIEILIPKAKWAEGVKQLSQLGIPIALEVPTDGTIDFDAIESKQKLGLLKSKTDTSDTKLAETSVSVDWHFNPAVVKPTKKEADRKAGADNEWIRVRLRVVP